jgi:hypothetical protein
LININQFSKYLTTIQKTPPFLWFYPQLTRFLLIQVENTAIENSFENYFWFTQAHLPVILLYLNTKKCHSKLKNSE